MKHNTEKILHLHAENLPEVVEKSAEVLRRGGVLVYPTDTVYGLGGDPFQPAVVERIYTIKGRDFQKPIHVLIGSLELLDQLVDHVPGVAQRLMDAFWPGPLTLIFKAKPAVQGRFLGPNHSIGIRLPDHAFCRRLSAALERPILSTSANLSGGENPLSLKDIPPEIRQAVDVLVDSGRTRQPAPSTIVNVSSQHMQLIREGAISWKRIEAISGEIKSQ
ncbi:MAG: threonylcarbamoyl-AMP synthase [Calditrichaeota bacterium]|nr:threonylcarbamoyl-AMP synthase [Calditrichota bacterium]